MNRRRNPNSGFASRAAAPARRPARRFGARGNERGFALLLTLTLIGFVVVLLVGLAAYTRIETTIAGNTQRQAQARENALLALNLALGQLQQHAGRDTRVTATADSFAPTPAAEGEAPGAVDPQKRRYTGVWDTEDLAAAPRAWLASGGDATAGIDITAPVPAERRVTMVGARSDGSTAAEATVAELVDIRAPGVPGQPAGAETPIGRYAWWIGDQGVKAPVAVPDAVTADYAPFVAGEAVDLRARIAQQIGRGAGAATADGAPVFEPRDSNNAEVVGNNRILAANQLALVRNPDGDGLGLAPLRQHFHAWSPNNFAVLANTRTGGLREDLSLNPARLGQAFAAWTRYPDYMEKYLPDPPPDDPAATPGSSTTPPTSPAISPAYGVDPLRRRYVMTPHLRPPGEGGSHQVGPVLTYFLLSFNVRVQPTAGNNPASTPQPLEVRARWMVSLWNPYTSALVPENLRLEISDLPSSVRIVSDAPASAGTVATFSLSDASSPFGEPLRIALPWPDDTTPSWLPGRVHTWRARENTNKGAAIPAEGFSSEPNSLQLVDAGAGVVRALAGPDVDGDDPCRLVVNGRPNFTVRLFAARADGDVLLGRFTSPDFVESFETDPQPIGNFGYQLTYVFRLAESIDTPDTPGRWLTAPGRDPRRSRLEPQAFVVEAEGNNPAAYGSDYRKTLNPSRLLDRGGDSLTYNEDVPLFELPRAPILSMGALQHFRLVNSRPFMIGNPWGVDFELNGIRVGEVFDRFFFTGLVDGVTPTTSAAGDLALPNPLMKPLRKANGTKVSIDDIHALMNPAPTTTTDPDGNTIEVPGAPTSFSSKYLLQGGAFNVNSTQPAAWAAVLRSVRFTAAQPFTFLNPATETGTADDADRGSDSLEGARFFRFSHSAQETFKAEAGESAPGASDITPPPTHHFRRGVRTLSAAQVGALAAKIVELVRRKHGAAGGQGGPFRSLEEFLSPSPLFAGVDADGNPGAPRSLLEAAIADAEPKINVDENGEPIEFSSQFLTQADIMTALAPVLFPRSDTFVIRTYGEAVNPATQAVEGRAWCEAIVQRFPEYLDPADDPVVLPADITSELNKVHGRRFKVVSFRWLTRSDI